MDNLTMPTHHCERYDLRKTIELLTDRFAAIQDIYVFGSRRYVTGSPRSDVDLLIRATENIKAGDLRDFSLEHGPALDLFLAHGGAATSCANESHVSATSFDELVAKLDAVHLWARAEGFKEARGFQWSEPARVGNLFSANTLKLLFYTESRQNMYTLADCPFLSSATSRYSQSPGPLLDGASVFKSTAARGGAQS